MTEFRGFFPALIALVFGTELTFFAIAEESRPFSVEFTVPLSFDRPVIEGTTNLPNGTVLSISLKTPSPCRPNCQYTDAKSTVKGGRFIAGPFYQKYGLESPRWRDPQDARDKFFQGAPVYGTYALEIIVPLAETQPTEVQAIIGPHGENLRGPYLREIAPGSGVLTIWYTSQITILARH
jgi:hypothetical protein